MNKKKQALLTILDTKAIYPVFQPIVDLETCQVVAYESLSRIGNKELYMNIEELLNKYFEGETTCEEERELRRFFTRGIVPEHLQMYRPMFAFLNEENRQSKTAVPEVPKTSVPLRRRLLYIFSGMAAGILLILGIAGLNRHFNTSTANYVIIDGKCYTDAKLVREQAMIAFRDVSISEEEVFATLFSE